MHKTIVVLVGAMCFHAMLLPQARASDAAEGQADTTEWGVLAELVGKRLRAEEGGAVLVYEWTDPGREMRQATLGSPASGPIIRRGGAPGELLYRERAGANYTGRAAADGSLTFAHNIRRSIGFRLSRASDGGMLREGLRIHGGEVFQSTRYVDISAMHAAAVAAGPSHDADPTTWGLYARLVGMELSDDEGNYRAWRWGEGDEIIEDRGTQGVFHISPGGEGGLWLRSDSTPPMYGTIASDGDVLWTMRVGGRVASALGGLLYPLSHPHRIRAEDSGIAIDTVHVSEGKVASVLSTSSLRGDGLIRTAGLDEADGPQRQRDGELTQPAAAPLRSSDTPQASAGTKIASSPARAEPRPAPLQAFTRYLGQRMVDVQHEMLQMDLRPDGSLAIQFYGLNGQPRGGYVVAQFSGPGELRLSSSAYGDAPNELSASWSGGVLAVSSRTATRGGLQRHYVFQPSGSNLVVRRYGEDVGFIRGKKTLSYDTRMTMRPMTEALAQEAALTFARRQEQERQARIRREEQSRQRAATFQAVMGGLVSGLSQGYNEYQYTQQAQRQFLDETAIRAQASAAFQQQQAQRQAQQQQAQRQQQQQADHDALARQLADGIAYRDAQAANATDPRVRQHWQAQNERAMQEAQRLGLGTQVGQQVAANRQVVAGERATAEQAARAAEAERQRDMQQRQAAEQAERQRIAAEQANAERQRQQQQAEAERQRQAEARRAAEDRARQDQQATWQRSLAQARDSLRLGATTCPGGAGRYYVTGPRANVQGCVSVSYEARCVGTPSGSGSRGRQHNYVGGSCLGVGDAIAIPNSPLSCPVSDVRVEVLDVTGC